MKKLSSKVLGLVLIFFLGLSSSIAQDSIPVGTNYFVEFQNIKKSKERLLYFFNTENPYNKNSGFDWLDKVNDYLHEAEKNNDDESVDYYKIIRAQIYFDIGSYEKSLSNSKELYYKKDAWDLETKAILLDLMDRTYSELQLYPEQIEIRKERNKLEITDNVTFHDIYSKLGLHRKAMNYYILEEKKSIDDNDYYGKAVYEHNIGNYLRLDNSCPVALNLYNKANNWINLYEMDVTKVKTEKELAKIEVLKAVIEGNIGKCYAQLDQYEEAIPYLERSIEKIKKLKKDKFSSDLVENKLTLAECFLKLGNFKKTTDYLTDNLKPRTEENLQKMNMIFASYYDKIGDHKSQAKYLLKNLRIIDSIQTNFTKLRNEQQAILIAEDQKYTKTRLAEQKEELAQSRDKMVEKEDQIQLVFISLIFTLLGFAGLVYAYLKSIKNQRLIAEQKNIIENALVEKDSLLKEIHHRVKNNLQMVSSLLSLQTKNTRSKAAIEALEEGKSRVKAMALIHQKLYQNEDLSVIEMQGYIESLINSVQSVFKKGGHNINITIDAEGVELDIDRAIPFGLILNELVSNSFKYAFPNDDKGKIYIHLRKELGQPGFFEYTDNGVGLPEDTDERTKSSMGIRLMNRLVNQLQSNLNIDKTSEGVRFWFDFK